MTTFPLLEQPWVPVMKGGLRCEVSLREALSRAREIAELAVDDPLQAVAVLRQVLLPVVLDAFGMPADGREWAERWAAGSFDAGALSSYFAEHAERFDLFDSVRPFGQVAGLRTERDETKPVSLLLAATATGNNVPLFTPRTESDPPALSPAEAARALLAAQCWDTAAIKSGAVDDPRMKAGKTTGNPTGPLGQLGVIVPFGRTLFETLMLNTPILADGVGGEDRPQWRAEPATAEWEPRPAKGLLDLLTWQSRRIRLVPEFDRTGAVVVRRVVVAAGDRLDPLPMYEPHTAWRRNPNPRAGQGPVWPVRHQPGRAAWRGLASMLASGPTTATAISTSRLLAQLPDLCRSGRLPKDLRLQVLTVGVEYGNRFAVVEDVMVDLIPLPVLALTDSDVRKFLLDVVGQADELRDAANRLGDDLRRAAGGEKLPWDRSQRLGDALVHQFTPVVRRMLAGLQDKPHLVDDAEAAWRQTAARLALEAAEPALAAAPPEAFLGRELTEKVAFRLSVAEWIYTRSVNKILGINQHEHPRQEPDHE